MPSNLTKEVFQKMDEQWGDQMEKLFGPTLIGYPEDTDSSRQNMLTSNLKQILSLVNPDVPHVQTHYENIIGEHNRVFKRMKGTWEVQAVIPKFDITDRSLNIYTMVLYNKEKDLYDVVEKTCAENLTEKFGFVYDNSKMDSLDIGDKITDEMLYKTPSYDEYGNYRLGKNALISYTMDTSTIEDAIRIRKGWAEECKTVEIDKTTASVNNNDVLLNTYGDETTYKPIPNIGEMVKGSTICAVRRISGNRILYDFQSQNMQEPYSTDTEYFASKGAILYDLDIFYNGDDPFPDNVFFHQLKIYYDQICRYADAVTFWCKKIKNSGSKYTKNVTFLKSKYQRFNDPNYKWKKDKTFTNMVLVFHTKAIIDIHEGFKLVGRYGDKGVVSKITQDINNEDMTKFKTSIIDALGDPSMSENERQALAQTIEFVDDASMPYMEDGTPIDILLNGTGSIRRLNTGQNYEVEFNFQGELVRRKMLTLPTLEEKAALAFRFLELINADEKNFFFEMYNGFELGEVSTENEFVEYPVDTKEAFIRSIEKNGFYIVKRPDAKMRYDVVKSVYDEFPWIQPIQLYCNIFGIIGKPLLQKMVVGSKYMYLLKQTSNKNYSARSTGRVNKKGLPAKSNDKRDNLISHSNTPIKIGEAYNLFSAISGVDYTMYTLFMRSSPIARKSLKKIVAAEGNPLEIKSLKIKPSYRNANALMFQAYMKGWGIRLHFVTDNPDIREIMLDSIQPLKIGNTIIYDRPSNKPIYAYLIQEYHKLAETQIFIETETYKKKETLWDEIFQRPEVIEMDIPESIKELLIRVVDPEPVEPEKPKRKPRTKSNTTTSKTPVKKRAKPIIPKVDAEDEDEPDEN